MNKMLNRFRPTSCLWQAIFSSYPCRKENISVNRCTKNRAAPWREHIWSKDRFATSEYLFPPIPEGNGNVFLLNYCIPDIYTKKKEDMRCAAANSDQNSLIHIFSPNTTTVAYNHSVTGEQRFYFTMYKQARRQA
jgi:hypothetical protein